MLCFLGNNIIEIVASIIVISILIGIKKAVENSLSQLPQRIHELQLEKTKMSNALALQKDEQVSAKHLQIDSYYRSISGDKLERLFSEWADFLLDMDKISNTSQQKLTNKLNGMMRGIVVYGSERTVRLASIFMQYNFSLNPDSRSNNTFILMLLYAKLIASLKMDFTGYEIDPEDILKMKINDLCSEENKLKLAEARLKVAELLEGISN